MNGVEYVVEDTGAFDQYGVSSMFIMETMQPLLHTDIRHGKHT